MPNHDEIAKNQKRWEQIAKDAQTDEVRNKTENFFSKYSELYEAFKRNEGRKKDKTPEREQVAKSADNLLLPAKKLTEAMLAGVPIDKALEEQAKMIKEFESQPEVKATKTSQRSPKPL